MNTAELKLKLFRQIDQLDKTKLEELYGLINNYTRLQIDTEQWDKLSKAQQQGIYKAMDELNMGQHIVNDGIFDKYREKYSNE